MLVMSVGFGIVFLAILNASLSIGSNEAYIRQMAVVSMGLDLQSLQSLGEDINAERDITDAGPYKLVFESGRVYMEQRGQASNQFFFTQVPKYTFIGGDFSPEKGKTTIGLLKLYKSGKFYGVAKPGETQSHYLLECNTPEGPELKSIAIDPGHGFDGAGDEGDKIASLGISESKYTLRLANALRTATGITLNPTRAWDKDSPATIEARKKTTGDALISLHAGSRADDLDAIKAYYNANNQYSRALACEILNSLTTEFNVPVRPVPVDATRYASDDPKKVLDQKRPAVMLEIGNARKTASILSQTGNIAAAIINGVKRYG